MTERAEGTEKRPGTIHWNANEEGNVEDIELLDDSTYANIAKQARETDGRDND